VVVVGDRILSDVVMGNHYGMFTIYVDPLNLSHENFVVRFVRCFENRIVPWITPRDKEAPKHPTVKEI
jgi:predicted HAD superfamily phosphohydrolase YqeG